jgi:tripartite-type tricarboxylate transporter receptor subunit TctC
VVSRVVFIAAYLLVCIGSAGTVRADWPDRPIRWVVPFGPGGANDLIARVTADAVSKRLGQPVVIENRPGAGAVVGTAAVAKAAGDGQAFLVGSTGVITNSLILKNLPYADSELVPVGMVAVAPSVIVVHPSVPAGNMGEFVAWAKKQGQRRQLGHRRQRHHPALCSRDDQGGDRHLAQHHSSSERE